MTDPQRPDPDPQRPDPDPQRPEPVEGPPTEPTPADDHDDTGLDLARSISRQVRGVSGPSRRRRPRRRPTDPQSSGARPDGRDPQLLGAAMEALFERQGWTTTVNLHLLLGRWPSLVGEVNAEHSWPERYADQVLTVRADSTAWATSLRTMAPQLVARLNEALGQGTVTRITVLGPDVPSWKHGRRSIRGARGPRDTYG
ncbi:DUF721 domain-containing protein [Desertihabitans aurantiacus]|uniref:DUF721 domain-containing protein n=1 Tax=Desertihabitans aurantiacus TaxID=2282477 RepID=UPI000DF82F42|nr:DciA family protein [Desertihabitans aurantiacus]